MNGVGAAAILCSACSTVGTSLPDAACAGGCPVASWAKGEASSAAVGGGGACWGASEALPTPTEASSSCSATDWILLLGRFACGSVTLLKADLPTLGDVRSLMSAVLGRTRRGPEEGAGGPVVLLSFSFCSSVVGAEAALCRGFFLESWYRTCSSFVIFSKVGLQHLHTHILQEMQVLPDPLLCAQMAG